jgi:hypothetical protein
VPTVASTYITAIPFAAMNNDKQPFERCDLEGRGAESWQCTKEGTEPDEWKR